MSSLSLFPLKSQYFFAYAIMGSLLPFLSVFLKQKGLADTQIGLATSLSQIAVLLTPVVLSILADSHIDSRRIMAVVFVVSSAAMGGLYLSQSLGWILLFLCLQSLAYVAVLPLLDALNFAVQQKRDEAGHAPTPYERIRVWGTLGFIVPGVLLFALLRRGEMSWILVSAAFFGLLGAWNSLRLPTSEAAVAEAVIAPAKLAVEKSSPKRRTLTAHLPAAAAGRALLRTPVLVFCVSLFLCGVSGAAFSTFFPIYLTDSVGMAPQWIGPISNLGVIGEIGFMLAFSKLVQRFGFKRLMLLGIGVMAARMALLAAFPIPAVAVATQLTHGMWVLATMVAPVTYLNQQAEEGFRNSIQGLYTMAVVGTSRIIGSFVAGYVAQISLPVLFVYASALTVVAVALMLLAFHDHQSQAMK